MDRNIINHEAAQIAHRIASYVHKPVEDVVMQAMREYAGHVLPKEPETISALEQSNHSMADRVSEIQKRIAALPILDNRSPEDIIGYDAYGTLPHGS